MGGAGGKRTRRSSRACNPLNYVSPAGLTGPMLNCSRSTS